MAHDGHFSTLGGDFGSTLDHFGATLASLWGDLGSLWDHFGATLGSLWVDEGYLGAPWVAWNSFWGPFGALWDHFGAIWDPPFVRQKKTLKNE